MLASFFLFKICKFQSFNQLITLSILGDKLLLTMQKDLFNNKLLLIIIKDSFLLKELLLFCLIQYILKMLNIILKNKTL